jgi:hypothetical protein
LAVVKIVEPAAESGELIVTDLKNYAYKWGEPLLGEWSLDKDAWDNIRAEMVSWHDSAGKECSMGCGEALNVDELKIREWSKMGKWVVAL